MLGPYFMEDAFLYLHPYCLFQETYPQTAPIWFCDEDNVAVTAAIEKVTNVAGNKNNVSYLDTVSYVSYHSYDTYSRVNPLTLYQTMNFRLFQTERVCRQQFQI